MVANRIETVTSHIATPYLCTPFYDRMRREGRIIDDDLSHYDTAHVVIRPKNMTPEELYEGYLRVYREVYTLGNIWRHTSFDEEQLHRTRRICRGFGIIPETQSERAAL